MESFPDELRGFVPDSVRLEKECLIMARAIDFDGTPSKTLFETGPIGDSGFWEAVDFITEVLDRERLYFFDIFYKGNNVLVKRLSETESVPLIVDFKRLGWQAYPLQPNLILESEKRRKFFRRLRRFEEAFRLENP
ncbi:MAG: hypothetical protein QG650_330 [Patescibacteria group bacterium]|nr:hypothetical protein [Patescibacteria group bacterium]